MSQLVPAQASGGPSYRWEQTPTGSTAQFRGLSAVSKDVAWVGGTEGQVLRTVDGGKHWQNVSPPGAGALQFRDVEAFDAKRAMVLSIGTGEDSRIYRTVDGGKSWKVQSNAGMPAALTGEFAFAASGTCLVAGPGRTAWFASGGGDRPRVFRTVDGGKHWTVADSPMASGEAAGIFSLAFRGPLIGVAVGGDFLKPTEAVKAASVTYDGGRTWKLVPADKAPKGYRSGLHFVPWSPSTVVAVGPSGSDVSFDGGRSWKQFYDGSFDSVECAGHGFQAGCWASGANGAAARLVR